VSRSRVLVHALAALLCLLSLLGSWLQPQREHVPELLGLLLPAVGLLLAFQWYLGRARRPASIGAGALLVWAALMRLPWLSSEPSLSDDLYRYVWEGRAVALGADPFDAAPDDPRLAWIIPMAPEWQEVGHRELPAIYPPLAQWTFAVLSVLGDAPLLFRVAFCAADLLLVLLIVALLRMREKPDAWAALYAWHPLAAMEVGGSGHFEPLAIAWTLAGLLAWERRGRLLGWALWGAALATKVGGVLLAVFAARQRLAEVSGDARPILREIALGGAILLGVALLPAIPFSTDGSLPIGSLPQYGEHWSFNGALYPLLTDWFGYHEARRVVAGLAILVLLRLLWTGGEPSLLWMRFVAALLLLSPVVHPWYGLWLLALLPLHPRTWSALLVGLLPLSYLAWTEQDESGVWAAPAWVRQLEYGPPALLLLWGAFRAQRARPKG
jgi:hypothetical protein